MQRIAVIGAGLMGTPIALTLHQGGCPVSVFNRSPDKLMPLAEAGLNTDTDMNQIIPEADCLITMLSDFGAIQSVFEPIFQPLHSEALAGKTIIQMATISPRQSQTLGEMFQAQGADYLECPVLGSIPEAKTGQLILMVGSTPEQYTTWQPLLQRLGPNPLHMGPVGAAAAVKLAMNHLIAALTSAFALSLAYIQKNQVDTDIFMDVVRDSALYAKTYDKKLARMVERNFANPNFPTKHLLKDVNLFLQSLDDYGLRKDAVEGIQGIVQIAIEKGLANTDYSALYESMID
jgi:3-hydroxyisobutyrate dehydrogenase